jgi:hypothetical protein
MKGETLFQAAATLAAMISCVVASILVFIMLGAMI